MSGCGGSSCGGGCGSCRAERFTRLTPREYANSIARRYIPIVDAARDVRAQLGFRPYGITVVRTRWTGGRRGDGAQDLVSAIELLPVPLLSDLSAMTTIVSEAQLLETGTILVSEISGAYTEDQLLGRGDGGAPIGHDENVWWEVAFLNGAAPGECAPDDGGGLAVATPRRRFQMRSPPFYQATKFGWSVTLTRAHDARGRDGTVR